MAQYLIIATRAADGVTRVKFDHDPSEEVAAHRQAMIGHLVEQGHAVEHVKADLVHGHHIIIHSGPLKETCDAQHPA